MQTPIIALNYYMFFIIPFGIFIVSIALIAWVVGRKFVYLKKLVPEVIESSSEAQESFWTEFFPGLTDRFKARKIREHRLNFLAEFEKFLRKLRLLALKFDTTTNRLIHRVRKSALHHEGILNEEAAVQAEQEIKVIDSFNGGNKGRDLKEEEQKLILEIAKNPKEANLYKKLANIYMKTGEWQDAVESFKKAVELDPEDESIKIKLERASKKLEKLPT